MENWSAHHCFKEASLTLGREKAVELTNYARTLVDNKVAVVFSLGHLAKITGAPYRMLHDTVNRKRESANYRMYGVKKRSGGRRFIHSVSADLHNVQRFINQEILQKVTPHAASFAFHASGGIRQCAARHCRARWLFQFDLKDFFYDITEVDVYHVFCKLGYRSLLAFEMARLCTTTHLPRGVERMMSRKASTVSFHTTPKPPYAERTALVGVLPQGAPTSPMLSNLGAAKLDASLNAFSAANNMTYTRYADDITLSAFELPPGMSAGDLHRGAIACIRRSGFRENSSKTRIAGPGARKIVLGLLVDGDSPRLSRETYKRIDRHLHAAHKYGLAETASHERFDSAVGFYNHLSGLVAFVKDVDEPRWRGFVDRLRGIALPWTEA